MIDEMEQYRRNHIAYAKRETGMSLAKLAGMKIRVGRGEAAAPHFPYRSHRHCGQWNARTPRNG